MDPIDEAFELIALEEKTTPEIAAAVALVKDHFQDDASRVRAAARIAQGFPAGMTADAARRLVSASLKLDEYQPFLKREPSPNSAEGIAASMAGRKAEAARALKPAVIAREEPQSVQQIAERFQQGSALVRRPGLAATPPKEA